MSKLIKLTYQQIIDFSSEGNFEKEIFHSSYREFVSKFQIYNKDEKFITFNELKEKDGRANSLHFRLALAVQHIFDSLNKQIPGLYDQLGNSISFRSAELDLIDSSIEDERLHRVKVLFTTETLTLHEVIGEYLLLSLDNEYNWKDDELKKTFMVKIHDNLTISAYCEREQKCISEQSLKLIRNNHLFHNLVWSDIC